MNFTDREKELLLNNAAVYSRILVYDEDGDVIHVFNEDDYLVDWNYEDYRYVPEQGFIGQFVERLLDGNLMNIPEDLSLENKEIEMQIAVKDPTIETQVYHSYGRFVITKIEQQDTTGTYAFESSDYTKKFNVPFTPITYPCLAINLLNGVCNQTGVKLDSNKTCLCYVVPQEGLPAGYYCFVGDDTIYDFTTTKDLNFKDSLMLIPSDNIIIQKSINQDYTINREQLPYYEVESSTNTELTYMDTTYIDFVNNDFVIEDNQFEEDQTCRDVVCAIAKLGYTWARIGVDNKLHLDFVKKGESDVDTYDEIDTDKYYETKVTGDTVKPINKVLIGMSQVDGENIYSEQTADKMSLDILKGNTNQETYSGKNLVGIPDQTFTYLGINVTIKDGVITLNGTTTATGVKQLSPIKTTALTAQDYILTLNYISGTSTDTTSAGNFNVRKDSDGTFIWSVGLAGNSASKTMTETANIRFGLYLQSGYTYTNYSFRPQLEVGSTYTEYEKYVGGIPSPNPEYPQDVNNVSGDNNVNIIGKNLFDMSNISYTNNWDTLDVTFADGIIEFNGSNTSAGAIAQRYTRNGFVLPAGTYTMSWRKVSGSFNAGNNATALYLRKYSTTSGQDVEIATTNINRINSGDVIHQFTLSEDTEVAFEIYTNGAIEYNNFIISIQIEKGSVATPFEEYKKQYYNIDLPVINLFDKDSANILSAYINGNGKLVTDAGLTTIYIPCNSSTNYAIQKALQPTIASNRFKVGCCSSTPEINTQLSKYNNLPNGTTETTMIFKTDSTAKYLVFNFASGSSSEYQDILDSIQIEEGTHANAYVPYGLVPFGKNLFDGNVSQGRWNIVVGNVIASNTLRGFRSTNPIPIKPSTQYTISATVYKDTGTIYIVETDEDDVILAINGNNAYKPFNYVTDKWTSMTFTSHSSAKNMYWYTTGTNLTNYPNDFRVEEGSRASERSVELCNVYNYEDYEDDTVNLLDYKKTIVYSNNKHSQRGATIVNNLDGTFTISGSGNITGGAFGGGYTDLTHTQTVKLLKTGTLYFSCEASVPALLVEGKDGNTTVFQLSSYDGTTKTTEITQAMLDNPDFKLRYSFYSTEGRAITPKTLHPMVYQKGNGTFEPIKYKKYRDYITKNTGKNLFDISIWYNDRADHKWSGSGTFTITKDGSVISDIPNKMDYYTPSPHMNATNPTTAQKEMVIKYGLEVKPNTTYVLSFDNPNGCNMQYLMFRYDNECKYINHWASANSTSKKMWHTYTTSSNQRYLFIRFDNESYNTTPTSLIVSNIQIEENNVATDFEPYGNGEWYKYSNCVKYVLDNTIPWTISGAGVDTGVKCYRTDRTITTFNNCKSGYCDKARTLIRFAWDNNPKPSGTAVLTDGNLYFRISETVAPDIASFRTWVANNPVTVYTYLDSPICDKITYQPLIDQLNNINNNAHTYEGKTYINSIGTGVNAPIDITITDLNQDTTQYSGDSIEINGHEYEESAIQIFDNPLTHSEELRRIAINGSETLYGITYTPMNIDSIGHPWLEANDYVKLTNLEDNDLFFYPFDRKISYKGYITGTLSATYENSVSQNYENNNNIIYRLTHTEIDVDKANQRIESITQEVNDTSEKIVTVTQDIDGITTEIENINNTVEDNTQEIASIKETVEGLSIEKSITGGNNLIKNSVGYFGNDFWMINDNTEGNVKALNDMDVKNNSVSASALSLQNETIYQKITEIKNGSYYISFRYKKLLNNATCKLLINGEEFNLTSNSWKDEGKLLAITSNTIQISLVSNMNDSCLITDLMLSNGTAKVSWTQNANETYTDSVKIGKGITITATGSDTELSATASSIDIVNTRNRENTSTFDKYGIKTNSLESKGTIRIANKLIISRVGDQMWISTL